DAELNGYGAEPLEITTSFLGYHPKSDKRIVIKSLKKSPVQYLSWFYYDTLLYHRANINHLIELVGRERVLMGTDYPFPIEDPDPVATVKKLRLPAEDEAMIFEQNPMLLFRL
ncbi:MAG: amidohydrolase family protein, partial [Nitrospinota bacterium]|nr:amidohydrolase family protein [Nitrospinota bacterium]